MSADTPAAAEAAFYAAFEQSDLERMMEVWAPHADITCVHPLAGPLVGPSAIRASWVEIFLNEVPRRFELEPIWVSTTEATAIHTLYETITLPLSRQRFPALVATNVYHRLAGQWRMVLHHASVVGPSELPPVVVSQTPSTRH